MYIVFNSPSSPPFTNVIIIVVKCKTFPMLSTKHISQQALVKLTKRNIGGENTFSVHCLTLHFGKPFKVFELLRQRLMVGECNEIHSEFYSHFFRLYAPLFFNASWKFSSELNLKILQLEGESEIIRNETDRKLDQDVDSINMILNTFV
uniref:Uncharacterized protein n=1 Tax=Glossina pallidipes TaxID=7398 RepID=A0A1A9ZBJ5_GLOPL